MHITYHHTIRISYYHSHHDPTSAGQTAEDLLCGESPPLCYNMCIVQSSSLFCWCHEGADVPSLEVFEPGLVRPAPPLHVSSNEVSLLGSMYVGM